jgi:hypothetical protein
MLIKSNKSIDKDKILEFQIELNNYLTKEKELMLNTFSDEEINNAILNSRENNKSVPYQGGLGNNTKKNRFLHLDKEELMIPNEFKCLYELQKILDDFPFDKLKTNHNEFSNFFNPTLSKNKLKWLKDVFNKNQSPKEYAIMFCLLSQYNLIFVGDKKLNSLFRAWYDYIERDYPKSYWPIYYFIDDRSSNGFLFKNSNDPLFGEFEKRLKNEFL